MGCDYYIIKQLRITYENNDTSYIEVSRERRYIYEMTEDSDDEIDKNKYLQVTYEPRILFENGQWKNETIQTKYQGFITRTDIKHVVKEERRILRV